MQNCVHRSVTKRGLKSSDPRVRVWRGSGPGFGPDAGRWGDRMPGICVPGALEGNKGMVIGPGWSGGWCAGWVGRVRELLLARGRHGIESVAVVSEGERRRLSEFLVGLQGVLRLVAVRGDPLERVALVALHVGVLDLGPVGLVDRFPVRIGIRPGRMSSNTGQVGVRATMYVEHVDQPGRRLTAEPSHIIGEEASPLADAIRIAPFVKRVPRGRPSGSTSVGRQPQAGPDQDHAKERDEQ